MDQSTDEFGLDLGSFDIRDFVPDAEGGSMFDDQGRDKARLQAQRSLMQNPPQYYTFQSVSDPSNPNGPVSPSALNNPPSLSPLSLEQLNMLLNVGLSQPMMGQDPHQGGQGAGSALANSADALKEQLAQQIKLQQLQQLQNHILQQQIQLLTAGARGMATKDVQQLLTPASTDIRSASHSTQVSPNILPPGMFHPSHPSSNRMHAHFNPNSTMSAPANLAFSNMSGQPMPQSPTSDFLTPLTSPVFPPVSSHRGNTKRSADVFDGDMNDGTSNARKRVAHANSFGNLNLNMGMTTVSPALLSSVPNHRRSSLGGGGPMDTPSPIDLSMPPPANPANQGTSGYMAHHPHPHPHSHSHSHMGMTGGDSDMNMPLTIQGSDRHRIPSGPPSSNATATGSSSTNVSPDLLPATPSLLMNMGNLPLPPGLVPPMMDQSNNNNNNESGGKTNAHAQQPQPQPQRRGKTTSRSRGLSASAIQSSSTASGSIAAAAKTRRATANAAAAASAAGGRGASSSTGGGRTTSFVGGGPKVKATHKDAEQKRRDSLKTSFDELRLLLPPIPLSSSATGPLAGLGLTGDDSDEAPLPGAMPPRGPPRGEGDGPNKGVSKLVLLRCGNEFIRDLVGRVERRDEEIGRLRNEVRRLRNAMGMGMGMPVSMGSMSMSMPLSNLPEESVDVDKDLEKEDEWYREERRRARKKKLEEEEEENMADG